MMRLLCFLVFMCITQLSTGMNTNKIEDEILKCFDNKNSVELLSKLDEFNKVYRKSDKDFKKAYYKSLYFNLMDVEDSLFFHLSVAHKYIKVIKVDLVYQSLVNHDYVQFLYENSFYDRAIRVCDDMLAMKKLTPKYKFIFSTFKASSLIELKKFNDAMAIFDELTIFVNSDPSLYHNRVYLKNNIANLEFYRGNYTASKAIYLDIYTNYQKELNEDIYLKSVVLEFLADSKIKLGERDAIDYIDQGLFVAKNIGDNRRTSLANYMIFNYNLEFEREQLLANQQLLKKYINNIDDIEIKNIALGDLSGVGYVLFNEVVDFTDSNIGSYVLGKVNTFSFIDHVTNDIYTLGSASVGSRIAYLFSLLVLLIGTAMYVFHRRKMNQLRAVEVENADLRIQTVREKENVLKEVSRDLHDAVLGKLFALKIRLFVLNDTKNTSLKLNATVDDLSEIEQELRFITNNYADNKFMSASLKELLEIQSQRNLINIPNLILSLDLLDEVKIENQKLKLTLLRILQEVTVNIAKHSKANQVCIDFKQIDGECMFTITDNGVGFNNPQLGHGLQNIKKRTSQINGTSTIKSELGKGTEIKIRFKQV